MLKSLVFCIFLWHEVCEFSSRAHPGLSESPTQNVPSFVSPKSNDTDLQSEPRVVYNINITQIFYVNDPSLERAGFSSNFNRTDNVFWAELSRDELNRRLQGASTQGQPKENQTTMSTTTSATYPGQGYRTVNASSGSSALKMHPYRRSWSEARHICIGEGGDLAVMRSKSEENMVERMMEALPGSVIVWIGVYGPQGKKDWITVFDEPLGEMMRWVPFRERNEQLNGCVAYFSVSDSSSGMHSVNCNSELPFVCKRTTI